MAESKNCHECKWCRPFKLLWLNTYELASCGYPVNLVNRPSFSDTGVFCQYERLPTGSCGPSGWHWQEIEVELNKNIAVI
ncbi:MAG: hypothetical protein KGI54_15170 [Pseudomonadota bacterium]|nr:hypothetical protein [Pseudomonadota bacterium]